MQRKLFRKTCSDELFDFGFRAFSGGFPPLTFFLFQNRPRGEGNGAASELKNVSRQVSEKNVSRQFLSRGIEMPRRALWVGVNIDKGRKGNKTQLSVAQNGPFGTPSFTPKNPPGKFMWFPFLRSFQGNEAHKLFFSGPKGAFWVGGKKFVLKKVTVVAEMITELIRFEPEICICNGNSFEFRRESVSVPRRFLLKSPQICLCNGN